MVNNLKCPNCGAELVSEKSVIKKHINYACPKCLIWGTSEIWNLAISGKRAQAALKIAFAALKHARNQLYEHNDVSVPAIESIMQEIESITKQDKEN